MEIKLYDYVWHDEMVHFVTNVDEKTQQVALVLDVPFDYAVLGFWVHESKVKKLTCQELVEEEILAQCD